VKTSVVRSIKQAVREWFGLLSIEEIIVNRDLSYIFEKIESLLAQVEESNMRSFQYEKCPY
jgi:hypothetical protein